MRTFLAVRPPADALDHLAARLPDRTSAPERWHVTLVFLGEVEAPTVLADGLGAVCASSPPLRLHLAGSGVFGRGGPVWVGVRGDVGGLSALAGALADACRREGVAVERRPYRPHLTVGGRGRPDPRSLADYEGPAWTAAEVELVASHLGPTVTGPTVTRPTVTRPTVTHDVLTRLPLAAAGGPRA